MSRRQYLAAYLGFATLLGVGPRMGPETLAYAARSLAAPGSDDRAGQLVDAIRVMTLEKMRTASLEQGALSEKPWSGWFFPLNEGGLATRYADPNFPKEGSSWDEIRRYLLENLGQGPTDQLSPLEKYDLLLGDPNYSMTRKMIRIISSHAVDGVIEPWKGYCTGWAAASMMMPRPRHAITVLSRDGRALIHFFPSDLKALAALLWSTGIFPTRYVGSLCQQSPIERDPRNDRPIDQRCRDTSPATWHLAVVNQIGLADRSLLFDSDPGFQIWNQPLAAYRYRTFHPVTGAFGSIEDSRVELSQYTTDKFSGLRAPGTRWIVGVEMAVDFVFEKRADAEMTDSPTTDSLRSPIYRYDLELDAQGTIIGGEWWTRIHPDVIWVPLPRSIPSTVGDDYLAANAGSWPMGLPVPEAWAEAAKLSVATFQPLSRIVFQLFQWAR